MAETAEKQAPLPVTVSKPTPYTFDLGLLLAADPNPLSLSTSSNLESDLAATARDGAQALLNQLLSTCPITDTPGGVLLSLPAIETRLPREKPLPPPKKETTWSRFAAKKGIKPKTAEARKKLVYDEATGEWVPKWGYKGKNKEGEGDWIVEVDDKKRKDGEEQRGDGRRERKEKVRRNERLQRKNEKGQKRGGK
ncbi:Regulator of ribosome biosynthesis [Lachnellula occidentalis]|uniref:Ribosome biogenesis regulatory protein n=1 Tax=Lachnellula occidentalis TaxID=215460 RepID=A0A8H8UHR8_9HELO|nr:Regulator of ribosome biosynthesis [Lachnellula occidentalis]